MGEAVSLLAADRITVSVITSTSYYSTYSELTEATGGINANINGNFAQTLLDELVPQIYEDVIS